LNPPGISKFVVKKERLSKQSKRKALEMASANAVSLPAASSSTAAAPAAEYHDDLNMKMMCPECKELPPNLTEEFSSGDVVCASCGLVLGDRIVDTRSEWRTFSNDDQGNDDPSRVGDGANPLLNGSQLQTTISFGDGGSGRSRDLHRAQNKSTHDKATKGLLEAYKEIGALCDSLNIPKTAADTAKHLFKTVDDAKAFKGKPQNVIGAGCIFIACRQCAVPRTFREIFSATQVPIKEIGRIFKALEKFFATRKIEAIASGGMSLWDSDSLHYTLDADTMIPGGAEAAETYASGTSTNPQQLCIRFCSKLGLPSTITAVSQQLAEKMSAVGALAGRSPLSAAAACIYMASYLMGRPRTAKEISIVAGVSDGTIRTAYKYLYNKKDELIDQEWIKDGRADMSKLPPS
jgi:transcription initiation factor TFIIB